jgi:predicted protein tyrosine phosphatase
VSNILKREDVVELIRVDMPDHTDGAFDIRIESDDGGTHIVIYIDEHKDSQKIMKSFSKRFEDSRIIIMKVPEGYLK